MEFGRLGGGEGGGVAVETRKDNDRVFFFFVRVSVCVFGHLTLDDFFFFLF